MLTLDFITSYYRQQGCTCAQPPVAPGMEHEGSCKILFQKRGLLERLRRMRSDSSGSVWGSDTRHAGLLRGRGLESVAQYLVRQIRQCVTVGEWHKRCVGGVYRQKRYLPCNAAVGV